MVRVYIKNVPANSSWLSLYKQQAGLPT